MAGNGAPKRDWLPEDIETLRRLRAAGKTYKQIAAELGRSAGSVSQMLRKIKVRHNFDWAGKEERLLELLAAGVDRRMIADELGCSFNTLGCKITYLKQHGAITTTVDARHRKRPSASPASAEGSARLRRMTQLSERIAHLRRWAERAA